MVTIWKSLKILLTLYYVELKIIDMKRIYKVNENYFEKIDTPEKAYILGFFYADGYNNEEIGVLEFVQKEERIDILEQIKECLKCDYKIKEYTPGK